MTPSRRAGASGVSGEDEGAIGDARSVGKVAATSAAEPELAPASGGASVRSQRKAAGAASATGTRTARKTTKETVSSAVTQTSSTTDKDTAAKKDAKDAAEPSDKKQAPAPRNGSTQPAGSGRAPAAAKKAPAKKPTQPTGDSSANGAGPYAHDPRFLVEQRELLDEERVVYKSQASDLKAEADSLAQEREPGDVQFDEESGEGGTVTVDRERDLALSAQALAAVEEIDAALSRIDDGTYGACERCHQAIPKPRLKALPFARLCVACKSGGLSRR